LIAVVLGTGCAHRRPTPVTAPQEPPATRMPRERPEPVDRGHTEQGLASWYGEPYHGRRTASGEVYDMHELTAAHRTLGFGTVVRVTRRDTGAEVTVRITDRGPFIRGRIIDLSFAAAKKIGLDHDGVAPVKIKVVGFEAAPKRTGKKAEPAAEPPTGGDCVWIQVGAFSDLDNAERAERRLESAGETAVIIEGPGGLHRVRVGPFDRAEDAVRALERIRPDWPTAAAVPCG
jgi:rare lipoprotein A